MSIFRQVKSAVDFAIFSASPPSYPTNAQQWKNEKPFRLESQLNFCQQEINQIQGRLRKKIDPRSKAKLENLKRKVKSKISDLEHELNGAKGRAKKELTERIAELKDALKEIEVIKKSTTNYRLRGNAKKPRLEYSDTVDTATVFYDGTIGGMLNELKHAFQYETGKIDFVKTNNGIKTEVIPGLTYDLHDELETYKRQFAYDGILKLKVVMTEEQMLAKLKSGKIKSGLGLGYLEIKKMRKITANIIIRVGDSVVGDPLYADISKKSLDINSSIGDIIRNNPSRALLSNSLGLDKWDKQKPYIDFVKVFIEENPFLYVKY